MSNLPAIAMFGACCVWIAGVLAVFGWFAGMASFGITGLVIIGITMLLEAVIRTPVGRQFQERQKARWLL